MYKLSIEVKSEYAEDLTSVLTNMMVFINKMKQPILPETIPPQFDISYELEKFEVPTVNFKGEESTFSRYLNATTKDGKTHKE